MRKILISFILIILCITLFACDSKEEQIILDESMTKFEAVDALKQTSSFTYEIFEVYQGNVCRLKYYALTNGYAYEDYDENDNVVDYMALFLEDDRLYYLEYDYENHQIYAQYSTEISDVTNYVKYFSDLVSEDIRSATSYKVTKNKLSFEVGSDTHLVSGINSTKIKIPNELRDYKNIATEAKD